MDRGIIEITRWKDKSTFDLLFIRRCQIVSFIDIRWKRSPSKSDLSKLGAHNFEGDDNSDGSLLHNKCRSDARR